MADPNPRLLLALPHCWIERKKFTKISSFISFSLNFHLLSWFISHNNFNYLHISSIILRKTQMGFKEILVKVRTLDLIGNISLYALLLASLSLLSLVSLSTNMFLMSKITIPSLVIVLFLGSMFVVLLAKYIEWSVLACLEHGDCYLNLGLKIRAI